MMVVPTIASLSLTDAVLGKLSIQDICDAFIAQKVEVKKVPCLNWLMCALCCCPCGVPYMFYFVYARNSRAVHPKSIESEFEAKFNEISNFPNDHTDDTLSDKKSLLALINEYHRLIARYAVNTSKEDPSGSKQTLTRLRESISALSTDLVGKADANVSAALAVEDVSMKV